MSDVCLLRSASDMKNVLCSCYPPPSLQVMLLVEGQGEPGNALLPAWQGLSAEAVAADRGDAVPTDLVVSIELRYATV